MSMRTRIPLLYHPTNVAILDDEPAFIDYMRQVISHDVPYVTETRPERLLDYLVTHTYESNALSSLITKQSLGQEDFDRNDTSEYFKVDYSRLLDSLHHPDHFKMITVIFVDEVLRNPISGLDFCRQVREAGWKVKLVLLTGKAGIQEAIEALNTGIIDAYLNKGDVDTLEKNINQLIQHYSWEVFTDIGERLNGFLSHLMKPLEDEQFKKVFDEVCHKEKTVQFCILNSSCSFLLADKQGAVKQLLVCDDAAFKDRYDLAQDSKAPYEVLQALRGRQEFPFTKMVWGHLNLKGDAWENIMVSVDKVPGREWYYAVIDRPDIDIFSFKKYFDEVWPQP